MNILQGPPEDSPAAVPPRPLFPFLFPPLYPHWRGGSGGGGKGPLPPLPSPLDFPPFLDPRHPFQMAQSSLFKSVRILFFTSTTINLIFCITSVIVFFDPNWGIYFCFYNVHSF